MDPLTMLGIGSSVIGGIGSLFGSGKKTEIPRELRDVYNMLLQRSQEGLSDRSVDLLLQRAKTGLGQEAGALGALTQSRLTRQGAGLGVQNAALNRINTERLRGIGEATIQTGLADEQAKERALAMLPQLASMFADPNLKSSYGGGFTDLFQSGLNLLLNRPGSKGGGKGSGGSGFLSQYGYDNFYDKPGTILG